MPVIKDIRLYRSSIENISGNSLPSSFYNQSVNCILRRIVMKLEENGFSLGDFHHLYINFTTSKVDGTISLAKREIDKYYPWYRYYDVEISEEIYNQLESETENNPIISIVEKVLNKFATPEFDSEMIHSCISEALEQGEKMTMIFKEKTGKSNKVVVYLRYLNNGHYFPLLRVFDLENTIILEKDLPETQSLDSYGEIQISSKKVTIKPRKNCFSADLEPIAIEF